MNRLGFCVFLIFVAVFIFFTPQINAYSSYEEFFPLIAGKTSDEQGYNIKRLKEELRRTLILGRVKRANYEIELGIKRLLESEKLIGKKKNELALKSLEEADVELISASRDIHIAQSNGEKTRIFAEEARPKLEKVLRMLATLTSDQDSMIGGRANKVSINTKKLLADIK